MIVLSVLLLAHLFFHTHFTVFVLHEQSFSFVFILLAHKEKEVYIVFLLCV